MRYKIAPLVSISFYIIAFLVFRKTRIEWLFPFSIAIFWAHKTGCLIEIQFIIFCLFKINISSFFITGSLCNYCHTPIVVSHFNTIRHRFRNRISRNKTIFFFKINMFRHHIFLTRSFNFFQPLWLPRWGDNGSTFPNFQIGICNQFFCNGIGQNGYSRVANHCSGVVRSQRPFGQNATFAKFLYQRLRPLSSFFRSYNCHERMKSTESIPQRKHGIICISCRRSFYGFIHCTVTPVNILICKRRHHCVIKRGIKIGFYIVIRSCYFNSLQRFSPFIFWVFNGSFKIPTR